MDKDHMARSEASWTFDSNIKGQLVVMDMEMGITSNQHHSGLDSSVSVNQG